MATPSGRSRKKKLHEDDVVEVVVILHVEDESDA